MKISIISFALFILFLFMAALFNHIQDDCFETSKHVDRILEDYDDVF